MTNKKKIKPLLLTKEDQKLLNAVRQLGINNVDELEKSIYSRIFLKVLSTISK